MDVKKLKTLALLSVFVLILIGILSGCTKNSYDGSIEKQRINLNMESYKDKQGVKAIFIKNKKGLIYKFIIYGETNYSEYGTDILAAAVSTLSMNTANSINKFADAEMDYNICKVNDKPYLEFELNKFNSKSGQDKATVLIESLNYGLSDLENQYGSEYVKVIVLDQNNY